ncbi:MAG: pentapeptide repeat-containing protein [Elainellaceae cyanobacterium]
MRVTNWISTLFTLTVLLLVGIISSFSLPILWSWLVPLWNFIEDKDKLPFLLNVFSTLATITGGIILFLNYLNARNRLKIERRQNENRLRSERFSKAVELLGNKELDARVGGVYSLEKLVEDFPDLHWTIMEVLVALVQERTILKLESLPNLEIWLNESPYDLRRLQQLSLKINTDTQAALTVIGRQNHHTPDNKAINLSRTYLVGADLSQGNFQYVNFEGAILIGANLNEVNLREANINDADLRYASVTWADLSGAKISKTNCEGANFLCSKLENSDLEDSNFSKANLADTNLKEAIISGTIFNEVHGLMPEQIQEAISMKKAMLYGSGFLRYGAQIKGS